MFRPSRVIGRLAALAFAFGATAPGTMARADDVASYLEQRGMKQLLAVHLEQQLEQASADDRNEMILRLAGLYSDLLETVSDPPQRISLEEKSRKLLQQAPANSADELRLALLRASYRGAERIAENRRLRLETPEELESAKKTLAELIPQFNALRQQMKDNLEAIDRRMARAAGSEATTLAEQGDRARNLLAQCTFLNAWALYYQSWLNDRPENARAAETLFGQLVATDIASPQPSDVSVDLRSLESVARSVLGMALCKSMTASSATALAWVELLQHPNTFEAVRTQAVAWELSILLEHDEFRQARELIQKPQPGDVSPPIAWLRLLAVHALENEGRDRQASELGRFAITELASRGEIDQVLDLARRYGTQSLGDSGFALQYVKGVIKYQDARQSHQGEDPTLDATLIGKYDEAAERLRAAITESDAGKYPSAAGSCRMLLAWCRYFQSRFLDSRAAFEEAAASLHGDEAAEAMWMAIVSLGKVTDAGGTPELRTQLSELSDKFLAQYPSNAHAPKLRLRRALVESKATPKAVQDLLAIPPNSEVYPTAQRQASDLLYQMFRDASAAQKPALAAQFLSVAVPLIGADPRAADLATRTESIRLIARCRQVLEVALADGIDRAIAARAALAALDDLKDRPGIDLAEYAEEIAARRAQERLLADDVAAAGALADQLWARNPESIWARIAARAMFKHGWRIWKDPESSAAQRIIALDLVVRHGGRVLREYNSDPNGLDQPGAFAYYSAVAEASMAQWQQGGDAERGKAALFLYKTILEKRPRSGSVLHAVAVLSERFGDQTLALDCWRKLVAGTPAGTDAWFEAKFHQLELLAKTDPSRAREVMNQHKLLNPDFGPEPWGAKLKGLDVAIPMTTGNREPAAASAPAEAAP